MCMYVSECMYMYVCTCMYVYVCVYVCMYVCMYECIYMYECLYVCICTHMYVYLCTCSCMSETHISVQAGFGSTHSQRAIKNCSYFLLVWGYGIAAVVVISLCSVVGALIVPFMQIIFYQKALVFLISLAVGTLAGDALLHLLPHVSIGLMFLFPFFFDSNHGVKH